uniref:Transport and golgi organization 6 homolog (Drosophila) n=1 Tax=Oryzias sinensis TaxID=183150 RepID=A0A8C7ZD72_9TELE
MTSAIILALNVLTKPLTNAQASQQGALQAALEANRALLLERLQSDSSFEEVQRLREEVKLSAEWFCSDTEDATWSFVQECLLLLLALVHHMTMELERFQLAPPQSAARLQTAEMAPPLPPDVLSVSQQKTLSTALQFVVSLGLCPFLAPGVGVPLGHRSAFGAVVEKLICQEALPPARRRLLTTTNVLLQLAELSTLATLVFTRHLGDMMAALSQLGHEPQKEGERVKTGDECRACKVALKGLLEKVYQPIVIKELLILQGGPKQVAGLRSAPAWLRRLCGQLLSERLMQPHGVQTVVRAVLEGGTGGESDWRKCDAVARILVACPQQSTSADAYFRLICPQVLDLLHFKDKLTAQQFQRVATRAALTLVQERPTFTQQYLLAPLLAPLQRCSTACSESSNGQVVVEEAELTRCLEDTYKVSIWVVGNSPSPALFAALEEVLPVIFTLFCFTKQNVSHLRGLCQEILLWFLGKSEASAALLALRRLSDLQVNAANTCNGGSVDPLCFSPVCLCCSDEDDELYEKLSGEHRRLECLMHLLAELKDSDLPGDFFLDLLKEVKDEEEADVSSMTLLEVEQQMLSHAERQGQRLALLQVLAVMVESLQHSQLLRKTTQVVDFMATLLERACVGLDTVLEPHVGNPVESQTLSMGMGLVATILSTPQVSSEDYALMSKLLPPLDSLSQLHPDGVIQELAANLRAVITTRGAYRPENLAAPAASCSGNPQTSTNGSTMQINEVKESRTPVRTSSPHPASSAGAKNSNRNPESPTKPLSDWLIEACDPNVPTRAFALRTLTQMVQLKDPETVQLFLENLEHEDSFVYLSAIQGKLSPLISAESRNNSRCFKALTTLFMYFP